MDFSGSGNGWDRDYMVPPNEGKDYKWYISGIFPANWGMDYVTDPTFYENQKKIKRWFPQAI